MLLDCGANADCTPEFLEQFAIMGSAYMQSAFGIERPTVSLLNNGAEETKGSALYKESHQVIKNSPVNFIGNIEARDVLAGKSDVVVADGFSGNVLIKTIEGTTAFLIGMMKDMFKKNIITKLCAVFMMKPMKAMKASLDYTEYGGAPILGAKSVVIKAHGSSNAKAFYNAIRQAKMFAESDMIESITNNLEKPLDECEQLV